MAKGDRFIEIKLQDVFAEAYGAYCLPVLVSQDQINEFCGQCDHHIVNGVCKLVGSNDQARYVGRKSCGWASKNGTRGTITAEGFKS